LALHYLRLENRLKLWVNLQRPLFKLGTRLKSQNSHLKSSRT
jgi:hypothetical protein